MPIFQQGYRANYMVVLVLGPFQQIQKRGFRFSFPAEVQNDFRQHGMPGQGFQNLRLAFRPGQFPDDGDQDLGVPGIGMPQVFDQQIEMVFAHRFQTFHDRIVFSNRFLATFRKDQYFFRVHGPGSTVSPTGRRRPFL